jgi:hypothetical protein
MRVAFDVFGDESANEEIVAYGLVIVPPGQLDAIERQMVETKVAFRGSSDATLHCKTLLHGDQRARSKWSHLEGDEPFSLLRETIRRVRSSGARAWIGYLERRDAPSKMLFEGDGGKPIEQEVTDLHLVLFAYWAAMAAVQDIVQPEQMRAWLDPNKDRLRLLTQRKQLRLAQGFFPVRHDNKMFEPGPVTAPKQQLLELADIIAHCGARALARLRPQGKEPYEAVLKQMRPGLSYVHFNKADGPIISVEANTVAINQIRADLNAVA